MSISVVIPAHNEEGYISRCLDSIVNAKNKINENVEIIVVLNRCTDKTEEIAKQYNAKIIIENSQNLAKIRNAGLYSAKNDILVTLDADSVISDRSFLEILSALNSGKYIGGGCKIKFDRYSPGLIITDIFKNIICFISGIHGGMFWFFKNDFKAINGFDENLFVFEDADFGQRLKKYGKKVGKRFIQLPRASITTSSRKFDRFGDWTFFKLISKDYPRLKKSIKGEDKEFASKYWYDFNGK